MKIDDKLLEIICCPETKQDLKLADEKTISQLNALVEKNELKNRIKQPVEKKQRRQNRQRPPETAPRRFEDDEDTQAADDEVERGLGAGAVAE